MNRPRTPRYWSRMKAVAAAFQTGFERGIVTMLTRFTERLVVYGRWSGPATKTSGHVSGDALAWYVKEMRGCPLPNIWETKEDHADK